MKLTACTSEAQFKNIENLYLSAFPAPERKPFSLLLQKSEEGIVELLSIESSNGSFLGLAITVQYKDLVLLDYFAIASAMRGQNIGSQALHLLKERYAQKRFLLEIEDPEEASENQAERIRRKHFYLKNQMVVMPYYVELFGIKMQVLTSGSPVSYEEYHAIYESSFSADISRNVRKLSDISRNVEKSAGI